jgi:hypothetical protein
MRLLFVQINPLPRFRRMHRGTCVWSRTLVGLISVKTVDGGAVSSSSALFFIPKLRDYLEGFEF